MDRKNINKAVKLDKAIEEYTQKVDELKMPTEIILRHPATESMGPKDYFYINDEDTEVKPFVKNKKQKLIDDLIAHYTSRIEELEAEILTL